MIGVSCLRELGLVGLIISVSCLRDANFKYSSNKKRMLLASSYMQLTQFLYSVPSCMMSSFRNINTSPSDCQMHGAMADASLPLGDVADKGTCISGLVTHDGSFYISVYICIMYFPRYIFP